MKWVFYFAEGNLTSEVVDQREIKRITDALDQNCQGWLHLPGPKLDARINLSLVKCVTCEELKDPNQPVLIEEGETIPILEEACTEA